MSGSPHGVRGALYALGVCATAATAVTMTIPIAAAIRCRIAPLQSSVVSYYLLLVDSVTRRRLLSLPRCVEHVPHAVVALVTRVLERLLACVAYGQVHLPCPRARPCVRVVERHRPDDGVRRDAC